ncbi:mono/diheme cytochrome c family protein [Microvirga lupini]|uniref:Mono/diheme cytochrome c family protein n=1 Tax=Microvirga lupini TaxID=420324 RepID=A0A7W4YWN2_9HYPH|nr:cytochrome c [Microvirga lupini]MBB3019702.1 mono/diheme cytochrome c family protein [Microvirga lupini]
MRIAAAITSFVLLAACDTGTEERDAVASTRSVQRGFVPVPPGTIPRGVSAQAAALAPPGPEPTPVLLARGEERFKAFCTPCHGVSGHGDGPVVPRGFSPPPSYYEERLRALTPEQVVQVITQGKGRMFPYADRVLPEDRWAIAHYIKELQMRGGVGQESAKP